MADAKDISRSAFIITFGVQLILLAVQGTGVIWLTADAKFLLPIGSWRTITGLLISFGFGLRSLSTSRDALVWLIPSGIYLAMALFALVR